MSGEGRGGGGEGGGPGFRPPLGKEGGERKVRPTGNRGGRGIRKHCRVAIGSVTGKREGGRSPSSLPPVHLSLLLLPKKGPFLGEGGGESGRPIHTPPRGWGSGGCSDSQIWGPKLGRSSSREGPRSLLAVRFVSTLPPTRGRSLPVPLPSSPSGVLLLGGEKERGGVRRGRSAGGPPLPLSSSSLASPSSFEGGEREEGNLFPVPASLCASGPSVPRSGWASPSLLPPS